MKSNEVTLVIETNDGLIMRTIRGASLLAEDTPRGEAVESSSRQAAAKWGLPDFIFEPAHEQSGAGVREVSDGVLISGSMAAMIQVKSRLSASLDEERERGWLDKHIRKGHDQAAGSVRYLERKPVEMINRRDRAVLIDGKAFSWIKVVIVEHDDVPPDYVPPLPDDSSVVLLRRDWEFLFDHLRSTRFVLDYLQRVIGAPLTLGDEPVRYHELALADLDVPPKPPPAWQLPEAKSVSAPRAPLAPAGAVETRGHTLLRIVQEDIALSSFPATEELRRIEALSHLDNIPLPHRAELGTTLLSFMEKSFSYSMEGLRTDARIILPNDEMGGPILFMAASELSDLSRLVFRCRFELMHHDYRVASGRECMSVGVLLTGRTMRDRGWDTTMLATAGDLDLDPEYISAIRTNLLATRV